MIYKKAYLLWVAMIALAAVMVTVYQLNFHTFPHFWTVLASFVCSGLLIVLAFNRYPRFGTPFLYANIAVVTLATYYVTRSSATNILILFLLPVYSLLFSNRRYFLFGQALTILGYLIASAGQPMRQHAIFFIDFILFSTLYFFVSKYMVQKASEAAKFRERVDVFSKTIEARDSYTQGHSRRVSLYAVEIGRHVKDIDIEMLRVAGDLHDIGKISTPDSVLQKPGRLTAEEYEIIKRHPVDGANLIRQFGMDQLIIDGVLYHHERMDGSGYPEGLKGFDIPLVARILAIADTFDAMTTTRSYRKAFAPQVAYDEIVSLSGKFYDPALVECFIRAYPNILEHFSRETASETARLAASSAV